MSARPLIVAAAFVAAALPSVDSRADAIEADHAIVASFEHIPDATLLDRHVTAGAHSVRWDG